MKKIILRLFLVIAVLCLSSFSFAQFKFTDTTFQMGVQGSPDLGAHGSAWTFINQDMKLDLTVKNVGGARPDLKDEHKINEGSFFSEQAFSLGLEDNYPMGTHGAVWVDFDKDGLFDWFATTTPRLEDYGYITLYKNMGTGPFKDVSFRIAQYASICSRGVGAAYFFRDTNIHFFISNALHYPEPFVQELLGPYPLDNFLLNDGNDYFALVNMGIMWNGFEQGITTVDLNVDGWPDVLIAKWFPPSTIYLNNGSGFDDVGAAWGLLQTLGVKDNALNAGDLNNDGIPDVVVVGAGKMTIYINWGWTLEKKQEFKGGKGFHPFIADFDNDGDQDLLWAGYAFFKNDFANNGKVHFTIVKNVPGTERMIAMKDARGGSVGDYDNDGDLDVFLTDKKGFNVLLRNDINNSNWIQVGILMDHAGAIGGLGVKMYLYHNGRLVGYREVMGECGYVSQDMFISHFGLAYPGTYDLKIVFVDGKEKWLRNIHRAQRIWVSYGHTLTIESDDNGTTDPAPGKHIFLKGEQVQVQAQPFLGYTFDYWTVDNMKVYDNPITLFIDADTKIKAHFKTISPPANFTARRVAVDKNRYAHVLTWEPNPANEGIDIHYKIYQQQDDPRWPTVWLETVSANTFRYLITRDARNYPLKKDEKYGYGITSVTKDGFESAMVISIINPGEVSAGAGKKSIKGRR